jgi:hypothetical protein
MQDKTENVPFGSARRARFREGMAGSIVACQCKRGWQEGLKIPGALADRESSLRSTEAGRVRAAKIPDQPPLRKFGKACGSRMNQDRKRSRFLRMDSQLALAPVNGQGDDDHR